MCRIRRLPPSLAKVFQPLNGPVQGAHVASLRLLVLPIAFRWGRRHVATLDRYLEAAHHRTRFNNVFWVERWEPEAALHQKAQAWRRALRPGTGATLYGIIDDAKKAKRGQAMDAIATMQASTTAASIWGRQDVCGP